MLISMDTNDLACCSEWMLGKQDLLWLVKSLHTEQDGTIGPCCMAHAAETFWVLLCRLGCGTLLTSHWGQHVWRLPLSARGAAAEALEAAQGVRCTVEDVHPVPGAFLEVGASMHPASRAKGLVGRPPSTCDHKCS